MIGGGVCEREPKKNEARMKERERGRLRDHETEKAA